MPEDTPADSNSADLISAREAAERKACSRQAVYQALDGGTINDLRTGGLRLVRVDDAFRTWQPKPYGAHRQPAD